MNNQAIYCDCFIPDYKRHKILGSITSEGFIEILRGHKNKTIIEAREFMIKCEDCGYSKFIKLNVAVNWPIYET